MVTLGPRAPGGTRTMVLLHGFGADEHDLVSIAHDLDPRLAVVSLRGPHALFGGGRAWFNLEQTRDGLRYSDDEVRASSAQVAAALGELAAERGRLLVLGFSQGACMGMRAALSHPQHVAALISLSGVPARTSPAECGDAALLRGMPAFVAHGLHDPLLPLSEFRAVRAELTEAGMAVEHHEYPMGHMVSLEELDDLRAWLGRLPQAGPLPQAGALP